MKNLLKKMFGKKVKVGSYYPSLMDIEAVLKKMDSIWPGKYKSIEIECRNHCYPSGETTITFWSYVEDNCFSGHFESLPGIILAVEYEKAKLELRTKTIAADNNMQCFGNKIIK